MQTSRPARRGKKREKKNGGKKPPHLASAGAGGNNKVLPTPAPWRKSLTAPVKRGKTEHRRERADGQATAGSSRRKAASGKNAQKSRATAATTIATAGKDSSASGEANAPKRQRSAAVRTERAGGIASQEKTEGVWGRRVPRRQKRRRENKNNWGAPRPRTKEHSAGPLTECAIVHDALRPWGHKGERVRGYCGRGRTQQHGEEPGGHEGVEEPTAPHRDPGGARGRA